jgi:hypothetical protein
MVTDSYLRPLVHVRGRDPGLARQSLTSLWSEMDTTEDLAHLLAEFAHNLGRDYSIQKILDHLVERIVDVLPVSGAGVMVMGRDDDLHFIAASDDIILEIQTLQNELGEGPCLEAYRSGEPTIVPDLDSDVRFPNFSPRARTAGLAAVFTFPMSLDGHRFGALDLYSKDRGSLSDDEVQWAQVLADVAAAYIQNAQGRLEDMYTLDLLRQRSLHDPLTGPAQPDPAQGAAGAGGRPLATVPPCGGGHVRRHRPLQGRQRHFRPRLRRPGPGVRRRAADEDPPRGRHFGTAVR